MKKKLPIIIGLLIKTFGIDYVIESIKKRIMGDKK